MRLTIDELRAEAIIGIHRHERKTKQPILINLDIEIKHEVKDDEIKTTLDYEDLSNRIVDFVETSSFNLLETLVEKVLDIIFEYDMVTAAEVEIEKPQALKSAQSVSVISNRKRNHSVPALVPDI